MNYRSLISILALFFSAVLCPTNGYQETKDNNNLKSNEDSAKSDKSKKVDEHTDHDTMFIDFENITQIRSPILEEACDKTGFCSNKDYGPQSPIVPCKFLPMDFIECDELIDHRGDKKSFKESQLGCLKFGGQSVKDVQRGARRCSPLKYIQCSGNRSFIRDGFPCVRYNGHYFVTTLLFSLLLGFLGMDRFYLGHTGTAIGKLLTFGGIGLWWVVDIVLLVTGDLSPEDGSNWMPHA